MNEHTSGPWRVEWKRHGGAECSVGPENGFVPFGACGCCNSPWIQPSGQFYEDCPENDEEQLANARLIAAAPELLEACKEVMEYTKKRRAVDQAMNDTEEVYSEIHNRPEPEFVALVESAIAKAEGRL